MLREFFDKEDLGKKIEANGKKIQELQAKIAEVERQTAEIFETLEVTPEQVRIVLSDPNNFPEKDWPEIQKQMAAMEKISEHQRDITQVRQAYKQRAEVQRNWLFVR